MEEVKKIILSKICYTDMVYGRIRKKLGIQESKKEIEKYIVELIQETPVENFTKIGKNYYIHNLKQNIRITINSYTNRIITVDRRG